MEIKNIQDLAEYLKTKDAIDKKVLKVVRLFNEDIYCVLKWRIEGEYCIVVYDVEFHHEYEFKFPFKYLFMNDEELKNAGIKSIQFKEKEKNARFAVKMGYCTKEQAEAQGFTII